MEYRSWGHIPTVKPLAVQPAWRPSKLVDVSQGARSVLAYGNGRSYGDSCFNSKGLLIDTRALDKLILFDRETGTLRAEPGITFSEILAIIVPNGWFLPVTPGTSFVTLGGAIANDVHGKNHHCDGTFGRFVERLSLLRSDGSTYECSATSNTDLFNATIGGIGLTGLIVDATIKLMPIKNRYLDVQVDTFVGLDEFVQLSESRVKSHRYSVAWLDCAARGEKFARGVHLCANHAESSELKINTGDTSTQDSPMPRLKIPFNFPSKALNRISVSAFNSLYFHKHLRLDGKRIQQHFSPFFYPLDSIGQWNRIYGASGFHQYQFVVPLDELSVMERILKRIVDAGMGSFLAVLKIFGNIPSPGMLSFPREGICLALDFADRGARTVTLINAIDAEVREAGGAAYPAKDRLMSQLSFAAYYPTLDQFSALVDPGFQSDFWRRVHG